jgi:hypothetical protein
VWMPFLALDAPALSLLGDAAVTPLFGGSGSGSGSGSACDLALPLGSLWAPSGWLPLQLDSSAAGRLLWLRGSLIDRLGLTQTAWLTVCLLSDHCLTDS